MQKANWYEEFRAWCQRFHLSGDTAEMLSTIRSSSPVRKVRGRASNVAGRYLSPKMQRTIQFESQHVELWAIYAMERDETVLEYYDQPMRLPLRSPIMATRCAWARMKRQATRSYTSLLLLTGGALAGSAMRKNARLAHPSDDCGSNGAYAEKTFPLCPPRRLPASRKGRLTRAASTRARSL
jgi:hypothetical protein